MSFNSYIKYFFEDILKKPISEDEVLEYAKKFSKIMKLELVQKKYLIKETVDFIINNQDKYNFHIVSGSEHEELNYLCKQLDLANYFLDINGSPTPKKLLVKKVINDRNYQKNETILIGDAINDYDAAVANGIDFYGYNNPSLKDLAYYINDFNKDRNLFSD